METLKKINDIGGAGRNSNLFCSKELMTNLSALSTMIEYELDNLSKAIQKHLELTGKSQRTFAKECEVSNETISKIIACQSNLTHEILKKIAKVIGFKVYLALEWDLE